MKKFKKEVDMRSRIAMTDFLGKHFRYSTMNSWNGSTSYANNIKIYNLGVSSEVSDKLYDLIQTDEFWSEARQMFNEFAKEHNYQWQVATNGRNGGYLVLYQGFAEPSEYKSWCMKCGQRNFTTIEETSSICGVCHKPERVNYANPPLKIGTYPGKSIDMNEDFEDFSIYELKERVKLIQRFDSIADNLLALAVDMAQNYTVEDEVYYVPQTRKVLAAI